MKHLMRIGLVLALALGTYACGGDDEETTTDAGTKKDAGTKDSGVNCPTEMCNGICCPTNTFCNTTTMTCDPVGACTCGTAVCGVDSCGQPVCGTCPTGQTCQAGACVPNTCTPNCAGKACGESDGCGNKCVGTCPTGQTCNATTKVCENSSCTPSCAGKACGDSDGCNGQCAGACPSGQYCNTATYTCQTGTCTPSCTGKACGADDGCGNPCYGTCPAGEQCNATTLVCEPLGCTPECTVEWDDCTPPAQPSATPCGDFVCVALSDGSGACTRHCSDPSSCGDPMTSCFQYTNDYGVCWFNFCAQNQSGTPIPAEYYQPCDASMTGDGTCIPYGDGQGGVVGVCTQASGGAAGQLAGCSPEATRANANDLCPVGEFCLGWYPDPANPAVNKGTCLPLCNSSTNPNPAYNCATGYTCLDLTSSDPGADLGGCMRDCSLFQTGQCPDNGLGQPEGCMVMEDSADGLCWPHTSPEAAVGATCTMSQDDWRESCVDGATCLGQQGATTGTCLAYCDPAGAAGPTCAGTCSPLIENGTQIGYCQ